MVSITKDNTKEPLFNGSIFLSLHFLESKLDGERGENMRTKAIESNALNAVLWALMPENRLVCLVALCTGLRITDVLNIKTEQMEKGTFTVQEKKTGKRKRVTIPRKIQENCLRKSGSIYVFPSRLSGRRPRTRQAVWKDLKRVSQALRLTGQVAPHSLRKTYARTLQAEGFTLSQIQRALNHSDTAVTLLYTMADELTFRE